MKEANQSVAVVGGGVAGMAAASLLARNGVPVSLFEKEAGLGGDTFGVSVFAWDGQAHVIDGGVSDFNQSTFPRFHRFLEELQVEKKLIRRETGFMDENQRLIYFVTDAGKLTFWLDFPHKEQLEADIRRFRQESIEVLEKDQFADFTVQQYLEFRGYSEIFWNYHLRPRALGCFMMHRESLETFPIRSLVSFLAMHSIVGPTQPSRICLVDGISAYCRKFQNWFTENGGKLHLESVVQKIERSPSGVTLRFSEKGTNLKADVADVILATKPSDVLYLLKDSSEEERNIFSQIPFARDRIVIHTDYRLLPRSRRAWGAYNLTVMQHSPKRVEPTITRWQNNLSVLDSRVPDVFMTMNPVIEPDPHLVVREKMIVHPVGSFAAQHSGSLVKTIQGKKRTWYCGSYLEIPFLHENAFVSGVAAAEDLLQRRIP